MVNFLVPAGSQNGAKTAPGARYILFLGSQFFVFLHSARSDALRQAPGVIPEAPGTLPDQISVRFSILFGWVAPRNCRGSSGSAEALPGPASNLSNPLTGVPLGYGDSRSGLN